jgi:uncharacterized protein GlcG (DUF336 family)
MAKMKKIVTIAGAALLLAAPAIAQNAPAPMPPAPMQAQPGAPRDPLALPGDGLPPPMSAILAPATPPQQPPANPGPAPVRVPAPGPSLDLALEAAKVALAKCAADNLKVGVAVSNSQGVILVGLQMPEAAPGRVYNAARKNLSAIEFGVPNSVTREKLRSGDFATLARTRPNMTLMPGAVPLLKDGRVIGAIGISGASSAQDEVCSAAGAAAIASRL